MQALILSHPWIDDLFYEHGSFIALVQGKSVLLLKGGSTFKQEGGATIFCKNFYDNDFTYHSTDQFLKITLEELRSHIHLTGEELSAQAISNTDEIFSKDFEDLKSILPFKIKKAVLVSRENYNTTHPKKLVRHLFAQAISMSQGKAYGFWNKEYGIIGCTPEVLFEIHQRELVTEALAGTARSGQESELLNSLKDQEEHQFVIKDLAEKLSSLGLVPKVSETETYQFSSIIHLRTKISAEVNLGLKAKTLSKTLSPSAALGGYPKQNAKDFLLSTRYHKIFPSRFFGSVIGTDFDGPSGLVMIRNLQWRDDHFFIESGVGVVAASELGKELAEIKLKRKVVRDHYL